MSSHNALRFKLIYQDFRDVIIRLRRLNKSEHHGSGSNIVRRNLIQLYWSPLGANLPSHGTQFDIALRNHASLALPTD